MDQSLLQRSAEKLRELLLYYAQTDHEANQLLGALSELLNEAQGGLITKPIERGSVPGAYYFTVAKRPCYWRNV